MTLEQILGVLFKQKSIQFPWQPLFHMKLITLLAEQSN